SRLARAPTEARSAAERSFSPRRICVSSLLRPRYRTRASSSAAPLRAARSARAASASRASSRLITSVRLGYGLGLFRDLGQTRERLLVADGEVGQDLPVDFDLRDFQSADERAVGEPVKPGGRVDANEPESPEITLFRPAIPIRELETPHQGFARGLIELAPSAAIPLHGGHDLSAALPARDDGLSSWHRSLPHVAAAETRINRRMEVVSASADVRSARRGPARASGVSASGTSSPDGAWHMLSLV